MKATISITTPAGKTLEGFPFNINTLPGATPFDLFDNKIELKDFEHRLVVSTDLHKGDRITIEITE